MTVLRRKPTVAEIRHLIAETSEFKLPNEKALRTMRFMANKASQLQSKVEKALSPKNGDSKPINVSSLKELKLRIRNLPLSVPEEEMIYKLLAQNNKEHLSEHSHQTISNDDVSPHPNSAL